MTAPTLDRIYYWLRTEGQLLTLPYMYSLHHCSLKKTKGWILVRFRRVLCFYTKYSCRWKFEGYSTREPHFSRDILAPFSPRKCASSLLRGSKRSEADLFFDLRNAGKKVSGTFLFLRTFSKNGRFTFLRNKNVHPKRSVLILRS